MRDFHIDCFYDYKDWYGHATPDFTFPAHNGEFSFTLPVPPANRLSFIGDLHNNDIVHWQHGMYMNIKNVLCAILYLNANVNGIPYVSVRCVYPEDAIRQERILLYRQEMILVYVNNDVTVRGSMSANGSSASIDVNLKKGWNKVLATATTTSGSVTTGTVPSDLVWRSQTDMDMSLFGD